jgi:hypothetical protein
MVEEDSWNDQQQLQVPEPSHNMDVDVEAQLPMAAHSYSTDMDLEAQRPLFTHTFTTHHDLKSQCPPDEPKKDQLLHRFTRAIRKVSPPWNT